MKTIKIKIPKGFEADSFDKKTGELRIKETPKNIMERVKDFDDVLEVSGIYADEFKKQCEGLPVDEVAYRKLKLIAEALNEGWQPDWGNSNQYKYQPWFDMGGSSGSGFACDGYGHWLTFSDCGSRLCFKSSELATYAGKQFTGIYKDFLTL